MNKTLKTFALGALALAAQTGFASTEVAGLNILGYTEIDSRRPFLPIAIPYNQPAAVKGINITVADVVLTAPLTVGDVLYAYDHQMKQYDKFELVENADTHVKEWSPRPVTTITLSGASMTVSEAPKAVGLSTGYSFWLQRTGESTNSVVQVMGQLADSITVTVKEGEYVLLGAVGEEDLDLSSDDSAVNPFAGKAAVGDKIEVPQSNGSLAIYVYRASGWASLMRGIPLDLIKAGSGFWYARAKGAPDLSVAWNF